MSNDNTPSHDATRRPQSRFSAGQMETPVPRWALDDPSWPPMPTDPKEIEQLELPISMEEPTSALDVQVGGGHYKSFKIQPVEFIHANNLPFIEGCIIKYATRWREKGGIKDLEKIKHFVDLLIELEGKA